jgi:hypothetical protein
MYGGDGHAGNCLRADIGEYHHITFHDTPKCWEFIDKNRVDTCLPGRVQHRFRGRKTHGKLTIRHHGDYTCWWCKKTFAEVMRTKAEYGRRKNG